MNIYQPSKAMLFQLGVVVLIATAVDWSVRDRVNAEDAPATIGSLQLPTRVTRSQRLAREVARLSSAADAMSKERLGERLIYAVQHNDVHLIPLLIEKGADPDVRHASGVTPLAFAAASGLPDALQTLLNSGANANSAVKVGGTALTPLGLSLAKSNFICAKLLLERGGGFDTGSGQLTLRQIVLQSRLASQEASDEKMRAVLIRHIEKKVKDPETLLEKGARALTNEQQNVLIAERLSERETEWESRYESATAAIQEKPSDADGWTQLGELFYEFSEYRQSNELAIKSLDISPENIDAIILRAKSLRRQKKYREAIDWIARGLEIDPQNEILLRTRAYCLIVLGDLDGAERDVSAAMNTAPNDSASHLVQGRVLNKRGRVVDAMQAYKKAQRLDPTSVFPYYYQALIENKRGNRTQATELMNRAVSVSPLYSPAYNWRGAYHSQVPGGLAAAREDYFRALTVAQKDSHGYWPNRNLAIAALSIDDNFEAFYYAERSVVADPGKADGYGFLADIQRKIGLTISALSNASMKSNLEMLDSMFSQADISLNDLLPTDHELVIKSLESVEDGAARDLAKLGLSHNMLDVGSSTAGRLLLLVSLLDDGNPAKRTYVVRSLLAKGVDPNGPLAKNGDTLLHVAAAHCNDFAMIGALLEAGGDATAVNRSGKTPFDVLRGREDVVKLVPGIADSPDPAAAFSSCVDLALMLRFSSDLEALKALKGEHEREQREDARSEEEIADLETMIAAGIASGYDNSRQMALEMETIRDRWDDQALMRKQMAENTAAKFEALQLIQNLLPTMDALCDPGFTDRLGHEIQIRFAGEWMK